MTTDVKLDCYAVLGVPSNADDVVVRAAFAELTLQYEPNHFPGGPDEAEQKLSELTTAYEVLSDPVRRRRYDFHRRISTVTAEFDTREPSPDRKPSVAKRVAVPARPRRGLAGYALITAVLALAAFGFYHYSGQQAATRSPSPAAPPTAIDALPTPATPLPPPSAEKPATVAAPQVPASLPPETVNAKPVPAKDARANPHGNAPPAATAPEACTDVLTALGLCKPKSTAKEK